MAGTVSISWQLTGIPQGLAQGSLTIAPNTSNNFGVTTLTPASGANTVSVPSWAVGCIIQPAGTNATALTLKGVTGDTGLVLSLTNPQLISFAASPISSFVLTAASTFATILTITFF